MKFEDRAVAFIDVLGFKHLVNQAVIDEKSCDQLDDLVNLLSSAVPVFNAIVNDEIPDRLIPIHTHISDCIILSAPVSDNEFSWYNGVESLVMRAIQLSHFFLNSGYLLRGGITVGKVWHTASNIVGPAYQEAYLLETELCNPYVALSSSAAKLWNGSSRMCLMDTDKNTCFVNSLFDYYIPNSTEHGVIEETYKKYALITKEVLQSSISESAKEKWRWFEAFLESESKEGLKWVQA